MGCDESRKETRRAILLLFQAEGGIRDMGVTGVQTCALPIYLPELLEEEGGGLRLGVYAAGDALQQPRQLFLVLVVLQLDRRSLNLRMNYSLRRSLRLLGF